MKHLNRRFAHAVSSSRKGQGMTQTELAERVNLTQQTIARIESGRCNVLLSNAFLIAEVLGLSLQASLRREIR
jgi:DNA-binding XRE family transcriptional regulator